jgi:hypothetical protein
MTARRWAPWLAVLVGQLVFVGYVKDDAFIEYRFAANLAHGHGLRFNVGDPAVEGFTSFLWTAAMALPVRLGLDPLWVAKLVGALALAGVVALAGALGQLGGGDDRDAQRARWIAATNGSLIVWAQSGMEPVIAALIVAATFVALGRGRLVAALGLAAIGAAVRPELHLVVIAVALVAIARAVRDRDQRAPAALGLAIAIALVAALHAVRWSLFGALVPNTALVKMATFSLASGLRSVAELAVTGLAGALIALALVAAWRRRDDLSLAVAALLFAFVIYLVRVGRDEMILCRLFVPVLPLAIGWARFPTVRAARWAVLAVCATGVGFALGHLGVARYLWLGRDSYVKLADAMRAHARPGDLAVFQDLGRTPWEALDLRFIDPIGLVDREVAETLHRDRSNPFLRIPSQSASAHLRDYFFARDPRLFAFVAYVDKSLQAEVARRFSDGDREGLLAPFVARNSYNLGIFDDDRFPERYRYVDSWRRMDNYYLILYERR